MPSADYYEQSFSFEPWQNMVDVNADLIVIPSGIISDPGGFGFENADGTYTLFLGDDIVMGADGPVSGTVDVIYRLSSLDFFPDDLLSRVIGGWSATALYDAYRAGGSDLFEAVFAGNDGVDLIGPPQLGPLDASPLIETYGGSDNIDGSRYADEVHSGSGMDEIDGEDGNDVLEAGTGADTVFGGNGNDTIRGGGGNDVLDGDAGHDTIYGDDDDDWIYGGTGRDTIRGGDGFN